MQKGHHDQQAHRPRRAPAGTATVERASRTALSQPLQRAHKANPAPRTKVRKREGKDVTGLLKDLPHRVHPLRSKNGVEIPTKAGRNRSLAPV